MTTQPKTTPNAPSGFRQLVTFQEVYGELRHNPPALTFVADNAATIFVGDGKGNAHPHILWYEPGGGYGSAANPDFGTMRWTVVRGHSIVAFIVDEPTGWVVYGSMGGNAVATFAGIHRAVEYVMLLPRVFPPMDGAPWTYPRAPEAIAPPVKAVAPRIWDVFDGPRGSVQRDDESAPEHYGDIHAALDALCDYIEGTDRPDPERYELLGAIIATLVAEYADERNLGLIRDLTWEFLDTMNAGPPPLL